MLLKSDALLLIRQLIDDPSAKRWTDANLGILASMTLDSLWADILETNAHYNSVLDNLAAAQVKTPGYLDLQQVGSGYLFTDDDVADIEDLLSVGPYASLALLMTGESYATQAALYQDLVDASDESTVAALKGGGGQLSQRIFRLQKVTRGGREYGQSRPMNIVMEDDDTVAYDYATHVQLGELLYLFPLDTASDVELRYSYRPSKWTDLAATDRVEWPEGYEFGYISEIAGRALTKGGAEDPRVHLTLAATERARMMRGIKNRTVGPATMIVGDTADSWGSMDGPY